MCAGVTIGGAAGRLEETQQIFIVPPCFETLPMCADTFALVVSKHVERNSSALDAELQLASQRGQRSVPLADFFTGYRKTAREQDELIYSVRIPLPLPGVAKFYKVSKREQDDISSVAAAFALDLEGGTIERARLCFGGVAATPARALACEAALIGRAWNRASVDAILPILATAFTPMSDQRGSLEYRRSMVTKLFEKFWFETATDSQRRAGAEERAS